MILPDQIPMDQVIAFIESLASYKELMAGRSSADRDKAKEFLSSIIETVIQPPPELEEAVSESVSASEDGGERTSPSTFILSDSSTHVELVQRQVPDSIFYQTYMNVSRGDVLVNDKSVDIGIQETELRIGDRIQLGVDNTTYEITMNEQGKMILVGITMPDPIHVFPGLIADSGLISISDENTIIIAKNTSEGQQLVILRLFDRLLKLYPEYAEFLASEERRVLDLYKKGFTSALYIGIAPNVTKDTSVAVIGVNARGMLQALWKLPKTESDIFIQSLNSSIGGQARAIIHPKSDDGYITVYRGQAGFDPRLQIFANAFHTNESGELAEQIREKLLGSDIVDLPALVEIHANPNDSAVVRARRLNRTDVPDVLLSWSKERQIAEDFIAGDGFVITARIPVKQLIDVNATLRANGYQFKNDEEQEYDVVGIVDQHGLLRLNIQIICWISEYIL